MDCALAEKTMPAAREPRLSESGRLSHSAPKVFQANVSAGKKGMQVQYKRPTGCLPPSSNRFSKIRVSSMWGTLHI